MLFAGIVMVVSALLTIIGFYLWRCNETNQWLPLWQFITDLKDEWINTQLNTISSLWLLLGIIYVSVTLGCFMGWYRYDTFINSL